MGEVEEWLNTEFCINSQVDNHDVMYIMPAKVNLGNGILNEGYEVLVVVWDLNKNMEINDGELLDEETSNNG